MKNFSGSTSKSENLGIGSRYSLRVVIAPINFIAVKSVIFADYLNPGAYALKIMTISPRRPIADNNLTFLAPRRHEVGE